MKTTLKLKRKWLTDKSTIGELFFDNDAERACYTLEDRVREAKVPGVTAIPEGVYEVVISYSNRFKKLLPLLLDVPGFEGVRIHCGNRPEDTEGCILVGLAKETDLIYESRQAYAWLEPRLLDFMKEGKVYLSVSNEPVEDRRTVNVA